MTSANRAGDLTVSARGFGEMTPDRAAEAGRTVAALALALRSGDAEAAAELWLIAMETPPASVVGAAGLLGSMASLLEKHTGVAADEWLRLAHKAWV